MDNKTHKSGAWLPKALSCGMRESDSLGVEELNSYEVPYSGHNLKHVAHTDLFSGLDVGACIF